MLACAIDWPGGPLNGLKGHCRRARRARHVPYGRLNWSFTLFDYITQGIRTKPKTWFGGPEDLSQSPGSHCKIITIWLMYFPLFSIFGICHTFLRFIRLFSCNIKANFAPFLWRYLSTFWPFYANFYH